MDSTTIILGVIISGFIVVSLLIQVLGRNLPQN